MMFLFFPLVYLFSLTSCISFHSEFFLCDGLGKHCIVREVVNPSLSFLLRHGFLFSSFLFLHLSLSLLPVSISYSSSLRSSYLLCFPHPSFLFFFSFFDSVGFPVFFVWYSFSRRFYVVLLPLLISSSSLLVLSSLSLSPLHHPPSPFPLPAVVTQAPICSLPTPCFRLTAGLLTPSVAWSGVMAEVMCATYSHGKHVVALVLGAT